MTRAVRIQCSYIRPSLEWEVQESVLDLAEVVRGEVARVAVVHQEQPAERRRVGAGGRTLLVVVLGVGKSAIIDQFELIFRQKIQYYEASRSMRYGFKGH